MKLIKEDISFNDLEVLTEGKEQKKKYIQGPFLQAEKQNRNGRVYPQHVMDKAVEAYKKAIAIKPDYEQAKHILSSLTGETTNSAPRDYVENLFGKIVEISSDSEDGDNGVGVMCRSGNDFLIREVSLLFVL